MAPGGRKRTWKSEVGGNTLLEDVGCEPCFPTHCDPQCIPVSRYTPVVTRIGYFESVSKVVKVYISLASLKQ